MSVMSSGRNAHPNNLMERRTLLQILQAAVDVQSYRFARQAALSWLAAFPGDLEVNYWLARSFILEGKQEQGSNLLEKILRLDPENLPALKTFADISQGELKYALLGQIFALDEKATASDRLPSWARELKNARALLAGGQLEAAENALHIVMSARPDLALPAVMHIKIMRLRKEQLVELKFAELYHQRWPEALPFILSLIELQMESGDEARAVNLLHQCVASDAAGQVAERWWGLTHSYKPMWPERLEIPMDLVVPADVAIKLGWNRLPAQANQAAQPIELGPQDNAADASAATGAPTALPGLKTESPVAAEGESIPEGKLLRRSRVKSAVVREAEKEFEKLAKKMKRPVYAKADGRYPTYVVFSTIGGLAKQYGQQSANVIRDEMKRLADAVRKKPGWNAMTFFPDDADAVGVYGMKPAPASDPWKLKLALVDLDQALAKKGARIGAVLLVGGPDVIPFHRLPNPTDDTDDAVLSDNPYATLDSNYFVPEWPVGRLTGETGPDAGLLLQQLRSAIRFHGGSSKSIKRIPSIKELIALLNSLIAPRQPSSVGYTAAVWQNSSREVYRPVGESKSLLSSPPEAVGSYDPHLLTSAALGYYNLHGLQDTNEWYGQRDHQDINPGPDYPVALTATSLTKNNKTPQVVFTEACYGAYLPDKKESESIALKFLALGVSTFIGSTCTAYGAVGTPLVDADLLGYSFWKYLREGYNCGEAFAQAKITMAKEMNQRQGYLDGEDQKTLISFILLGDPLMQPKIFKVQPKSFVRQQSFLRIKTVSDDDLEDKEVQSVPEETLRQVKLALEPYLPGLDRAEVTVQSQGLPETDAVKAGDHKKPARQTVVTFKKPVQVAHKTYFQFARVTLDGHGKLKKMAISR